MKQTTRKCGGILGRFNRLIRDLLRGEMTRNSFRLWEAEILLDIMSCDVAGPSTRSYLRRYQKAAQRQMAKGGPLPLKFSEYLDSLRARRPKAGSAMRPAAAT
jgi:hypothetical protein